MWFKISEEERKLRCVDPPDVADDFRLPQNLVDLVLQRELQLSDGRVLRHGPVALRQLGHSVGTAEA